MVVVVQSIGGTRGLHLFYKLEVQKTVYKHTSSFILQRYLCTHLLKTVQLSLKTACLSVSWHCVVKHTITNMECFQISIDGCCTLHCWTYSLWCTSETLKLVHRPIPSFLMLHTEKRFFSVQRWKAGKGPVDEARTYSLWCTSETLKLIHRPIPSFLMLHTEKRLFSVQHWKAGKGPVDEARTYIYSYSESGWAVLLQSGLFTV